MALQLPQAVVTLTLGVQDSAEKDPRIAMIITVIVLVSNQRNYYLWSFPSLLVE